MDHRAPLKMHTVLAFPGMLCQVEEVIGCGANAICYKGWYPDHLNPDQRHHVLIKEMFPFHPQGKVHRDIQNRILADADAQAFFETHRKSFEIGNEIHLRLLADHPEQLGANLNSYALNGTVYSVLGYTGGRSLQEALQAPDQNLRVHTQQMLGLLDALEAFHKSGYLHLDISPDNIMMVGSGEKTRIFLIDYNSARPVGAEQGEYVSCKAGYSAPEVEGNEPSAIGFAADLYSVAAVFYRCLMGRALTLEETLRAKAPDGKDSPYMRNVPETVSSMIRRILKKGLNVLPARRYQSIGQMRQAFSELLDRIDCVGVTHWSLWENGKRSVEELIRINPSFRYLKEEDGLYPIRIRQGESMSLERYLEAVMSPEGNSGLILAQGGMGKTTLLLHTAMLQGKRYSAAAPAVFYISLSSWNSSDPHYIQNQILMRLRFKRETNTFDSALHALQQLLQQPLKGKNGDIPVVLLLLDGLNEAHGDLRLLIQEIHMLSAMAGVRILAASRSAVPALSLTPAELIPLNQDDVEGALGKKGLLLPENPKISLLLRTPLVLSIYIQASSAGKQLNVQSEEELLKAYMDALYQKELRGLPENAAQRWQLDAALNYVLPAAAWEISSAGSALTEEQLLKVVEKCWNVLKSSRMQQIFPQWIGHSWEILGNAQNAEQWYGLVIHSILWQRLGLLMKESGGGYLVFHQRISEFLAQEGRRIARTIRKKRVSKNGSILAAILCAAMVAAIAFLPKNYDETKTEQVIDSVVLSYSTYGYRLSEMQTLTEYLLNGDVDAFLLWYDRYLDAAAQAAVLTDMEQDYLVAIDALCQSGDQVSWSAKPFDGTAAKELVTESSEQLSVYLNYLPVLKGWAQSQRAQANYPDFPEMFAQLLDADTLVMSKLYYQSCDMHLVKANPVWRDAAEKLLAEVPGSGAEPEEKLTNLRADQSQALRELAGMSAGVERICLEENQHQ